MGEVGEVAEVAEGLEDSEVIKTLQDNSVNPIFHRRRRIWRRRRSSLVDVGLDSVFHDSYLLCLCLCCRETVSTTPLPVDCLVYGGPTTTPPLVPILLVKTKLN